MITIILGAFPVPDGAVRKLGPNIMGATPLTKVSGFSSDGSILFPGWLKRLLISYFGKNRSFMLHIILYLTV